MHRARAGCGSLIHGSRQTVSFDTVPPGATIQLENGLRFTTPHTMELRRAEDHVVTIEKEGYEPERITLKRDFNAVATVLGNILWLVPGVLVDVLVGGAWTLDPEKINVQLVPQKSKSE
ncbi:MAG TPA: PEGA domain-containing protein [Nitrospira sp.]|nr:PEGA domain-containing protein [Nitrospira sp.]